MTNNALPARKSHRTLTDLTLTLACLSALVVVQVSPGSARAQDTDTPADPSAGLASPTEAPVDGSPETLGTTTGDGEGEDEAAMAEEEEEAEEEREEAAEEASEEATEEATEDATEEAAEGVDDEAAAEEAQAAAEPLAWRNSFFSWTQGLTFNSLVRDGQQTYNPNYYWSFSLLPRWYLDPRVFLIASLGVSYELTDSDFTAYNRELQLSDSLVELRYTAVVDRFVFIPAVRLTVPTSKFSQAGQRYFNTGIGLTSVLQIPEISSLLALGLSYRRWWSGSNVPLTQNPYPGSEAIGTRFGTGGSFDAMSGDVGSNLTSGMGGAANAVDRLLVALTLNVTPVSGLTLTLQGLMIFDRADDLAAASLGCEQVATTPCGETLEVEMMPGPSMGWRAFTYFTLAAAYDVQPWLNVQLGIANSTVLAPLLNDDGSVRSPFNPDTQVYLATTFTLDGIYTAITAGGEDDGLTPEQRQRRRQGLASLDLDEERDLEGSAHEEEESPSTRTLVGF